MRTYQRLMEAEARLDDRRRRAGLPEDAIAHVLDEVESDAPVEDRYLRTIAGYVAALGGRVEVHAVFEDETIRLPVALPQ